MGVEAGRVPNMDAIFRSLTPYQYLVTATLVDGLIKYKLSLIVSPKLPKTSNISPYTRIDLCTPGV